MNWHWPILTFVGNAVGFYLLSRNPDFKFGAKEQEWFVNAVWFGAQYFLPFMLILNFLLGNQIKDRCNDSWLLNAFLNFVFLVVPAVIEHLVEYPQSHINVKNVKEHNSQKRNELLALCSFALSSWGLSNTYKLTFESGLFSVCLEHAMKLFLSIINKEENNRDFVFIFSTFGFCFMVLFGRKYLEKSQDRDTARRRNDQSLHDTNTADQSPGNNDRDYQSPLAAPNTNDFQFRHIEIKGRLALDGTNQHEISFCGDGSSGGSMANGESRDIESREELWDVNEQNWENVPPRLYNDNSSNSGDTVNEDKEENAKKKVDKDVEDSDHESFNDSETQIAKDQMERIKYQSQESDSQGYKIHDNHVPPKISFKMDEDSDRESSNESEAQIVKGQIERSKDQSQESDSQGYKIDDNPLLPKSSFKKDDEESDHKSSDDEERVGDYFHCMTECKLCGVGQRCKDQSHEIHCQEQGIHMRSLRDNILEIAGGSNSGEGNISVLLIESKNMDVDLGQKKKNVDPRDGTNYKGKRKRSFNEGTSKPLDDRNDDSADDEATDDSDFNDGAGRKVEHGQRGINKFPLEEDKRITKLYKLREAGPIVGVGQSGMTESKELRLLGEEILRFLLLLIASFLLNRLAFAIPASNVVAQGTLITTTVTIVTIGVFPPRWIDRFFNNWFSLFLRMGNRLFQ